MDGVLIVPYTNPEVFYKTTMDMLEYVSKLPNTLVVVTSFNPLSYHIFKPFLDNGTIKAIRAGSLIKWWDTEQPYSDEIHRTTTTKGHKGLHISDMLDQELKEIIKLPNRCTRLIFADDDPKNIIDVSEHFKDGGIEVLTIQCDQKDGLTLDMMQQLLSHK